ncbi:hypothetical protein DQ04_22161000, partial [Trypanosoma grayi]|uniref:hypothetical protein n=1 Tax=Trypanosoma grayi TaxID=71804 RepID=UPI0004F45FB3
PPLPRRHRWSQATLTLMLRHVLCVLALALCSTSLCVATSGAAESPGELQLANGDAKITLTGTVDPGNCKASSPPAAGVTKDVTISTTVTLKKKDASEDPKEIANVPSEKITVPDGSSVTLKTSLEVKCTKKEAAAAATAETTCTVSEGEAATSSNTHDVTVKFTPSGQTAVQIPETENLEVKVPVGQEAKIIAKVVATCTPLPKAGKSSPSVQTRDPSGGQQDASSLDANVEDMADPLEPSLVKKNTPNEKQDEQAPQARTPPVKSGTPLSNSPTVSANPNDEVTGGEKGSAVSKDLSTPTSSEAESTETDNSATVNGADHTASTATPQSETTTEGATNTDAGTSTSAGEGVKLPD